MSAKEIAKNLLILSEKQYVSYSGIFEEKRLIQINSWLYMLTVNLGIRKEVYYHTVYLANRFFKKFNPPEEYIEQYLVSCLRISCYILMFERINFSWYTSKYGKMNRFINTIVEELNGEILTSFSLAILNAIFFSDEEGFNKDEREIIENLLLLLSYSPESYIIKTRDLVTSAIFLVRKSTGNQNMSLIRTSIRYVFYPEIEKIHCVYVIANRVLNIIPKYQFFSVKDVLDKFQYEEEYLIKSLPADFTRNEFSSLNFSMNANKLTLDQKTEKIGSGTYGNIYRVKSDNKTVAVKTQTMCTCISEIAIMRMLKNVNVENILQFKITDNEAIFSMEERHETLHSKIYGEKYNGTEKLWNEVYIQRNYNNRIDPILRSNYYKQLFNGLKYIHSYGIIHGDIKPENILITDDNIIKIIDFGLSQTFIYDEGTGFSQETVCSDEYRPRNLLKGKSLYSFGIDIWSAGVTLLETEMSLVPFLSESTDKETRKKDIVEKIDYLVIVETLSMVVNRPLRRLLLQMFDFNELTRVSAKEVLSAL